MRLVDTPGAADKVMACLAGADGMFVDVSSAHYAVRPYIIDVALDHIVLPGTVHPV